MNLKNLAQWMLFLEKKKKKRPSLELQIWNGIGYEADILEQSGIKKKKKGQDKKKTYISTLR